MANKTRRFQIAVVALFAGALCAYLLLRPRAAGIIEPGDPAPAFVLNSLDGKPLALADYRRKVIVLNFWATWCPPCVEETPSLEKFSEAVRPLDVVVLGVSVDDDPAALARFVAKYHLTYPIARDPGRALAAHYGTFKFPETYIIGRDGKVAEKIIGPMDWGDPRMKTFVEDLAGRSQAVSETDPPRP